MLGLQASSIEKINVDMANIRNKLNYSSTKQLRWQGLLFSVGAVALSTFIMFASGVDTHNVNMVFTIVTLLATVWFGLAAGSISAFLSFICFNYFFIPPLFTLEIEATQGWLAVFLFFGTALLANQIAGRARMSSYLATRRAQEADVLYDLATAVLTKVDQDEMLKLVLQKVTESLGTATCVLYLGQTGPNNKTTLIENNRVETLTSTSARPRHPDRATAQAVFEKNQALFLTAQSSQTALESGPIAYLPLGYESVVLGVLVLVGVPNADHIEFNSEEKRIIQVIAHHIALAVEHARLIREAAQVATLRDSDKLKTALLDSMSHELRTPLTSIKTATANLATKDIEWSDEEHDEFVGLIEQETNRLIKLVNNLLELSKIEAKALKPKWGWYYLPEIVEQVVDRLKYNPTVKEHPLRTSFAQDLPYTRLDYLQIDQVLTNLIDNAAKYSPPGSPIIIQLELIKAEQVSENIKDKLARQIEPQQQLILVKVLDEGRGIPPELLERIFEKFYRVRIAQESLIMDKPGTGIGLAICKGIIETHEGTIWAKNRLYGGSIFQFVLPVIALPTENSLAEPLELVEKESNLLKNEL